jgi:hypothetical protein
MAVRIFHYEVKMAPLIHVVEKRESRGKDEHA